MAEFHDRWEDLRVSATMVKVKGAQFSDAPVLEPILWNRERGPSYSGLMGYAFGCGEGVFQSAYFQAQLPHTYEAGTDIEPHVHVRLDAADEGLPGQQLLLEFEYAWTNISEKRPDETAIIAINHSVTAEELAADNVIISFGLIEKKDADVSSMLDCRFSRITFHPNWSADYWTSRGLSNDSFQGKMIFKEFDFHFRRSPEGSQGRHEE